MKSVGIFLIFFVTTITNTCFCQSQKNTAELTTALKKFPGFTDEQMSRLLRAKNQYCIPSDLDAKERKELEKKTKGKCAIPLPTWIPAGFKVEQVVANLGRKMLSDSLQLRIVYGRGMTNARKEVFVIEAGFEFGDIPYDGFTIVNSKVGKIKLYYEPSDLGKKLSDYVITEWFNGDLSGYPKYEYYSAADFLVPKYIQSKANFKMLSLEDTKRILASMEKL